MDESSWPPPSTQLATPVHRVPGPFTSLTWGPTGAGLLPGPPGERLRSPWLQKGVCRRPWQGGPRAGMALGRRGRAAWGGCEGVQVAMLRAGWLQSPHGLLCSGAAASQICVRLRPSPLGEDCASRVKVWEGGGWHGRDSSPASPAPGPASSRPLGLPDAPRLTRDGGTPSPALDGAAPRGACEAPAWALRDHVRPAHGGTQRNSTCGTTEMGWGAGDTPGPTGSQHSKAQLCFLNVCDFAVWRPVGMGGGILLVTRACRGLD